MQNARLHLHEIIWEITGQCKNSCKWCGSREVKNVAIDEDQIIKISEEIAKFPPNEIDISGGDPLLVSEKTHEIIVEILKKKDVKCKIIVNPKSFEASITKARSILSLYDWIGVSINSGEDIELLKKSGLPLDKTTIISNFNLGNIFNYSEIEEYLMQLNIGWMVQYTVFRPGEGEETMAIYNNKNARKEFYKKIQKSIEKGVKIILSDNLNCIPCSAGINSIGILFTGSVVPCLSMRSWKRNLDGEGNILQTPLKNIWKNGFNHYRFHEFECCKDICGNEPFVIKVSRETPKDKKDDTLDKYKEIIEKLPKCPSTPPWKINPVILYGVLMYGVQPNQVLMYGVQPENIRVQYYAVTEWSPNVMAYSVQQGPLTSWTSCSDESST